MGVDAYQSVNVSLWWICEVSVHVALGVFMSLKTEMVATDHRQKIKWTPMSGGGGSGDDGLGIRKY